jgi:hypothetical protein
MWGFKLTKPLLKASSKADFIGALARWVLRRRGKDFTQASANFKQLTTLWGSAAQAPRI